MIKNCPVPVDVQDIHFKLHCRLKLFENKEIDTFATPYSLIACASRYGLIFAGSISNLKVIEVSSLENYSPKDKTISDYEHRNIELPSNPKHISVNCDHTILAVVIEQNNCPVAFFYDVLSFYKPNVQTVTTVRLSANPGTYVTEIGWNPTIPAIFTACKSDGSLGIYELKGPSVEINEIPTAAEVSSFCWSPKGKQIAVGSKKGIITQYKPDLKAVRMINAPPLEAPSPLISLQWVSNYQFIGIYELGAQGSKLLVVDAPKAGDTIYTNYDDICYSGSSTEPQFFMIMQPHWNILLVASSNSAELAVLGLTSPDSWTQWMISDASRAELPLSSDRQETFPIGLGLDISNTKPYAWGESTIPPCPYVLMLSHQGILCIFNLVNLKNMPPICTPPDPIQDKSGLQEFQRKPSSLVPLQENEQKSKSQIPSASVENQNKHQIEAILPQLTSKTVISTAVPSNTTGTSLSSQVTSSMSNPMNLFSFTPASNLPQSTLFDANQKQPISLFGGQTAITPIKIQSTTKPVFEDISITPINKTQQSNIESFSDDKYSSIFSALSNPQNTVSLPIQVKPIVVSTPTNKTVLEKKTATATITFPKSDMAIGSKNENVRNKPIITSSSKPGPELSKIDTEAILQKMIKDDCISLEAEVKNLSQKTKAVNINLGSESDKIEMLNIIQNLEEFLEEISEISIGEHSEIHTLKQNLVLSWAWYEEALSRYNASKDDMMKLLIKSQPLDSATEKRYTDIKKLTYYIESQLLEVSKALDEQWDKFQDYVKKTYRVQMPTMEAIYQAMVRQNAVLQKQGYIMKDISSQLKKKSTSPGSLLVSVDNVHLEDELRRLQLDHQDNQCQLYENAVTQSKKLSSSKSRKLQLLLKNREVVHVTTIKSFIPAETSQSPNKRLSLIGAKMSPVPKLLEPKQIDFYQSTPFRNTKLGPMLSNSTEIETQSNKPLTFGKSDLPSPTTTNKIIPFNKTGPSYLTSTTNSPILSSNLPSAFVPTTQIALANKDKGWSPVASSSSQVPSAAITSKANASTQFLFASSTNMDAQKPASSSLSSFSFTNTNISNEVISSHLFLTPAKPTETSTLFGSSLPKTLNTTSVVSKVEKPSKIVTASSGVTSVTSANVTKPFTGFSMPVQTLVSKSASNTESNLNNFPTPDISSNSSAIKSPTISFGSTHSKESNIFNLAPKDIANVTSSKPSSPSIAANSLSQPKSSLLTKPFTASEAPTTSPVTSSTVQTTSSIISSSVNSSMAITSSSSPMTTTSTGTSIFGTSTTSSTISIATTSTSSIFASSAASSIFGSCTETISSNAPLLVSKKNDTGSLFSASSVSPATSLKPLFGTQTSVQSTSSQFGTGVSTTTTGSFFGSVATLAVGTSTVTSALSAFGQSPSVNVITTTKPSSTSVFASQAPAFGTSNAPSSSTSIFANVPKVDSTMKPSQSIFDSTNTPQTSIFGQSTVVPSTTSVFVKSPATTASIFGSTATTTQISIFGSNPTSTQTSIFGSIPTTTQTSIFAPTTLTTTQSSPTTPSSIFGSTPITTPTSIFAPATLPTTQGSPTTPSSIFASTPTRTQASIFTATNLTTTQSSFFGGPTSQASLFGSSAATSASTQSSIFGSATASIAKPVFGSTTSSTSIFASTTVNSSSPFGQSATTTFGSGFGGTSTAAISSSSSSIFGQQTKSAFGSSTGSIFGGTATTASGNLFASNKGGSSTFGTVSSSGNLFGSPATSSFSFASTPGTSGDNALNFGGLNVGNSTTTSGSTFGRGSVFGTPASEPTANPFGTVSEKSSFGGAGNLFANTTSTTASVFGSSSTFGANNQSFGSSLFGSTGFGQQQQQPAFGQNTFGSAGTFGSTQPGPFSSGTTGVAQSGFGTPTGFQKPSSGFGSAPVFGGSPTPAFGGTPSFGGAPAFGAAPSFGSPTKVFGSNTPTAAFGSPSAGSPGFSNLANQNTIGFGNLAKQATNSPSTAFSGNSSFSSWR